MTEVLCVSSVWIMVDEKKQAGRDDDPWPYRSWGQEEVVWLSVVESQDVWGPRDVSKGVV